MKIEYLYDVGNVSIEHRVLARTKLAAFIPDKFWREKKQLLKQIFNTRLTEKRPNGLVLEIDDRLIPFYKKFVSDLQEFGLPPELNSWLDFKRSSLMDMFIRICDQASRFQKEYWTMLGSDNTHINATDVLARATAHAIDEYYGDSIKTVGDGLKVTWFTTEGLILDLGKKLVKKATPEELDALVRVENGDLSSSLLELKYGFFNRVNLAKQAQRLVTKDKVDYNFLGWVDLIRERILENYTNPEATVFRNFDLHGMKIVVDDRTVSPDQIHAYVKYLKEAHYLIKSKGFEKAWYGTIFIECESCGGVNENGSNFGVGGNYHIGPDFIKIFSRPSKWIVGLIVHELGHRFWFKQMNSEQRERFKSLVKVRPKLVRPDWTARTLPPEDVEKAKTRVNELDIQLLDTLKSFEKTNLSWFKKTLDKFSALISALGYRYSHEILNAVHSVGADSTLNPKIKSLFDTFLEARSKVSSFFSDVEPFILQRMHARPEPTEPIENTDKYWGQIFKEERSVWLKEARQIVDKATDSAFAFINFAVFDYNQAQIELLAKAKKKWDDEAAADNRPVEPVSDYGKSNIDEAWAEAFMHFVVEKDMNQDQIESFRSVLKTAAERIVDRFLTQPG